MEVLRPAPDWGFAFFMNGKEVHVISTAKDLKADYQEELSTLESTAAAFRMCCPVRRRPAVTIDRAMPGCYNTRNFTGL